MNYISFTRIYAIFIKDFWEFSRNLPVSSMTLLIPIFALVYKQAISDHLMFSLLLTFTTTGMVTTFIQASFIAEEKERNTLRSLLMTPATLFDLLIGKMIVTFLISILTIGVSFALLSFLPSIPYAIAILLTLVIFCAFGLICGLYSHSILEATFTVVPVMFIFSFSPILLTLTDDYPILKVFEWLPNSQIVNIANGEKVLIGFILLIAWLILSWVIALYLCQRRIIKQ